ncbi:MAG: hypothetical protein MSH58_10430 [Clostridiales bacterium]|nr:hypothetical protein [Clostridiales bacterium]
MKGKRLVATMLALLLVVSLLPMAAMASNTNHYERIEEEVTCDYNEAANVTNYGTVNNNYADPRTSPAPSITPSIKDNNGTVVNNGGSSDSDKGTVVNNNSGGTVENNKPTGTVENNYGLVGKVVDGKLDTTGNYGNSGKVENNQKGGVVVNNKDGKVENNLQGGVVVNNSGGDDSKGVVENNYSSGDGTNPGVINNGGKVTSNWGGGVVVNNEGGYVNDNYSNGDGTNPGVINNGGTVNINNGTMDNYAGQVHFNNEGGKILNNYGIVGESFKTCQSGTPNDPWVPTEFNKGTVVTNHMSGEVTNNTIHGGVVEKNYGTVYDAPGQIKATYYGLHGEDENKETDTKYTEDGYSLGHTAGAEVNLDDTAASYQREGYKLSSYTVWTYDKTSTADEKLVEQNVGDRTKYTINAPTLLKLVWEKIVTAVASSGGGAEAVPTSYDPDYIGLGSVIFINEKGYKVVEIKDDAYVVVTFDALPDEDVQDLDALFAKLFTPEQQKLIKNVGQLLSSEDVLTVFGTPGNHPVYEISKDLVK